MHAARARKVLAKFVKRNRHHTVRRVECLFVHYQTSYDHRFSDFNNKGTRANLLNAITMVNVNVNI